MHTWCSKTQHRWMGGGGWGWLEGGCSAHMAGAHPCFRDEVAGSNPAAPTAFLHVTPCRNEAAQMCGHGHHRDPCQAGPCKILWGLRPCACLCCSKVGPEMCGGLPNGAGEAAQTPAAPCQAFSPTAPCTSAAQTDKSHDRAILLDLGTGVVVQHQKSCQIPGYRRPTHVQVSLKMTAVSSAEIFLSQHLTLD